MHKEKALEEFFKSLNMCLKNASLYFKEHPAFIKSVRDIKKKVDTILDLVSPLKISFTSKSVFVEEKYFEKDKAFGEIARLFHIRKIQSIEIRKGITIEELITFLTKIFLSPEVIIREGGLSGILKEENIAHLTIQELDYSELLMGNGEEVKDIWPYLLQDAVEQIDLQKIIRFADNFERFLQDSNTEKLIENDEIKANINKFFTYLKESHEDKYRKCSKDLLKSVIKTNAISPKIESEDTKMLFKDLSNDDFASVLWEEILKDESFNPLSFQIFSRLIEEKDQSSVANSFKKEAQQQRSLSRSSHVRQKIKELLTGSPDDIVSKSYQQTLSSILEDISYEGELTYDHNLVQGNYRFMLLNLLSKEKSKERSIYLAEEILAGWESIVDQRDLEFIKSLVSVLDRKRNDLSYEPIFLKMNKQIAYFVAEFEFNGNEIPSAFENVRNYLKETFVGINTYLDRMFKENKVGPVILQLYFQTYPDSFSLFKRNLIEKSNDIEFLKKITENLSKVDSIESLEALKCIFYFGNDSLKIKVLESLKKLSIQDEGFLFDILNKKGMTLKKEAVLILLRSKDTTRKVIEEFFSIFSPFGIKNKILLENVKITEELELKMARDKLTAISGWKSFWSKKLKGETLKVLEKWNARAN